MTSLILDNHEIKNLESTQLQLSVISAENLIIMNCNFDFVHWIFTWQCWLAWHASIFHDAHKQLRLMNFPQNIPINLLKALGFFFQATPSKYTGIPVNVIRQPIPVSRGAAKSGATNKKIHANPNVIGIAMLNYKMNRIQYYMTLSPVCKNEFHNPTHINCIRVKL